MAGWRGAEQRPRHRPAPAGVEQYRRIENGSHWVGDVVFPEDSGRVRTVPIAQVLAALRPALIGRLHTTGDTRIKAATLDVPANP